MADALELPKGLQVSSVVRRGEVLVLRTHELMDWMAKEEFQKQVAQVARDFGIGIIMLEPGVEPVAIRYAEGGGPT